MAGLTLLRIASNNKKALSREKRKKRREKKKRFYGQQRNTPFHFLRENCLLFIHCNLRSRERGARRSLKQSVFIWWANYSWASSKRYRVWQRWAQSCLQQVPVWLQPGNTPLQGKTNKWRKRSRRLGNHVLAHKAICCPACFSHA